jgi:hypothetical protein
LGNRDDVTRTHPIHPRPKVQFWQQRLGLSRLTSTTEWGVYEYTSRTIDRNRATLFAKHPGGGRSIIVLAQIVSRPMGGKAFAIPVCLVYQVNPDGLIDQVSEYVDERETT